MIRRLLWGAGLLSIFLIGCGSDSDSGAPGLTGDEGVSRAAMRADSAGRVRVIIRYKSAGAVPAAAMAMRADGAEVRHSYTIVPAVAASVPETALEGLRRNPNVAAVEPDVEVRALDAELDATWGVKATGAGTVHDAGNKGAGIKVAVIDSGVDYTHPDLNDNYAGGYDFVNRDSDPMDDNGHGTHVAGTIAAEDNSTGVVGMAPAARIYALKVLAASGSGYTSDIIAAVQWCQQNGIQVTNSSLGTSADPGSTFKAAWDQSAAAGIIHVASAGNSGAGTDTIGWPAKYDSVIAVCAIDSSSNRASFSSTGPAAELSAPGTSINSTTRGGGYGLKQGTSMASPHVAGAVALCLAAGVSNLRAALTSTAVDLGAAGRDTSYGYGRINVVEAVKGGAGSPTPPPPNNPTPPPPAPTVGTLAGRVIDTSTGAALSGATVKLSTGQSVKSSATGYYELTNLPTGNVYVTASAKLYYADSRAVTIVANPTVTTLNFSLRRKR